MYLYTASTTRRRQSPTKPNNPSIKIENTRLTKRRGQTDVVPWIENYNEEMSSENRKVLMILMLLWSSFILTSAFRYYRGDSDGITSMPKGPPEFIKTFQNTPECNPITNSDVDFTLVTHTSEDRLWMMEHHCLRWGQSNAISLAVFTDMDVDEIDSKLETLGCRTTSITIQRISISSKQKDNLNLYKEFRKRMHNPTASEESTNSMDYPINKLRNLALSAVKTSHALIVDIDFLPSLHLFEHLHQSFIKDSLVVDAQLAIVVPAFQLNRGCPNDEECDQQDINRMPYSRDELKQLIRQGSATIFDPTNRGGHGTTDYKAWYLNSYDGLVELPCLKSERYEPFVVVRFCGSIPPFQERFSGYGKNKLAWIQHILRSGFQITQIDTEFIVHYPHKDSASRQKWNKRPDILKPNMRVDEIESDVVNWSKYKRGQIDSLYVKFLKWLSAEVKDESKVPMCESYQQDTNLWVKSSS